MKTVHEAPGTSFRHADCLHCRSEILLAPHVGWLELFPGETYDVCPLSDDGRHHPDPTSDTELPYWMSEQPSVVIDVKIPESS